MHSRDRFLPLYHRRMHDEVARRLEELGVEVVLGERVGLPSEGEERGGLRKMKLSSGREVEYDLLVSRLFGLRVRGADEEQMRCTGQKPNSQLLEGFLPEAVNEQGFVEVRKTMQVASPEGAMPRDNVFVCGDVRSFLAPSFLAPSLLPPPSLLLLKSGTDPSHSRRSPTPASSKLATQAGIKPKSSSRTSCAPSKPRATTTTGPHSSSTRRVRLRSKSPSASWVPFLPLSPFRPLMHRADALGFGAVE